MNDKNEKIHQLISKLGTILDQQEQIYIEIKNLRAEIEEVKISNKQEQYTLKPTKEPPKIILPIEKDTEQVEFPIINKKEGSIPLKKKTKPVSQWLIKEDLEKFVGENLINKIGIAVTVIGVSIGAKYAIDNNLISPLTRIVLGYLVGFYFLGFAVKLKEKYINFSASLLSGAAAILFFITYAAFTFYELFPLTVAFLMLVITVFTVLSALNYDKQIIALFGLVGSYTIPFLLSSDESNILFLLSYVAIINIGILIVAYKKYWKILYYTAFVITWVIYLLWFSTSFVPNQDNTIALLFATLFFMIFYAIFLAYKIIQKEKFEILDILFLVVNTFIFYGIGYEVLKGHTVGNDFIGLFTLCIAFFHFAISLLVRKCQLENNNLYYLIIGLVITFITISIPVQLEGNWITIFWSLEVAILFWIGRTKRENFYEYLAYPLIMIAFLSLILDWGEFYKSVSNSNSTIRFIPLLNVQFLSSFIFIVALSFVNYLNGKSDYSKKLQKYKSSVYLISKGLPFILIIAVYGTFLLEIACYWEQLFLGSKITLKSDDLDASKFIMNTDFLKFKTLWLLNYTALFLSILTIVNMQYLRNKKLGLINLFINLVFIIFFLAVGLFEISELRTIYLMQTHPSLFDIGIYHLIIRYITLCFIGILMFSTWKFVLYDYIKLDFKIPFELFVIVCICWVTSSELLQWLAIFKNEQSYKLALSIFLGIYSLLLVIIGIWKHKKHFRIFAIVLFGLTLMKLFFYDIASLNTISKTIVFVCLGVLLIMISFLYTKYKDKILWRIKTQIIVLCFILNSSFSFVKWYSFAYSFSKIHLN